MRSIFGLWLTGLVLFSLFSVSANAQYDVQKAAQVIKELGDIERGLERLYTKCPVCKGDGKIGRGRNSRQCFECVGSGKHFEGEWQKLLDGYVNYCDVMTKYANVLEDNQRLAAQANKQRELYLRTIRREIGPRVERRRVLESGKPTYELGDRVDGQCNQLATEIVRDTGEDPRNHGIAFSAKVIEVKRKDDQAAAHLRIERVKGHWRTCWVILPKDMKWEKRDKVEVVGRIVADQDLRRTLGIEENEALVKPYHGTE